MSDINLKSRKIEMFRCHIDPAIGPRARNAFTRKDYPNADFELTPMGVYVRIVYQAPGNKRTEAEHMVPFANVQSIKFYPADYVEKTNDKAKRTVEFEDEKQGTA